MSLVKQFEHGLYETFIINSIKYRFSILGEKYKFFSEDIYLLYSKCVARDSGGKRRRAIIYKRGEGSRREATLGVICSSPRMNNESRIMFVGNGYLKL